VKFVKLVLTTLVSTTMVLVAFTIPVIAQSNPQVVADAVNKTATAGGPAGANADANCKDDVIESKAGGVVARAPCKAPPPPPPPPAPKAAAPAPAPAPKAAPPPPPPAPKAELPKSGGASAASLFSLGAGVLLVAGGLLVRRFVR
jgi:LPXTG-motif cell wall-anchored protein